MPLMELPIRTCLVDGVLLSPGSTLTKEELGRLSGVTDIVATNLFHLDGVAKAAECFPEARVWGPIGAQEKLPSVRWTRTLGVDAWEHASLKHVLLEGMPKVNDSVFVADGTLYLSDLAFNIEHPKGFGAWLILSMFGTHGRFGVSRFFAKMVKDRATFEGALGRVMAHDFDAVVPAHGAVVEEGGKERLRKALLERGFTPAAG